MQPAMTRRGPHLALGLILIVWGIMTLLDNLGLVELHDFVHTYWPLLIVIWGGWNVFVGHPGQQVFGAIVAAFGLILFGNRAFGWDINVFTFFWPLLIIAVGLRILFSGGRLHGPRGGWRDRLHARRGYRHGMRWEARFGSLSGDRPDEPTTFNATATATATAAVPDAETKDANPDAAEDSAATFRELAFLGGIERRNTSQAFRGGEATAFLGGIEIDLRECRMVGNEARIDVFACMGGVSLRLPRDWTVVSEVAAILGGFHDMSTPPVDGSAKRLVITGQAVMGGIEIKN